MTPSFENCKNKNFSFLRPEVFVFYMTRSDDFLQVIDMPGALEALGSLEKSVVTKESLEVSHKFSVS